jgi:hypothetical protein
MPILLLLYPEESPELLTAISLAVVFFNASSGTAAYARMKRIDYKSGIIFSIATIPGAILGSLSTTYINRNVFNLVFGIIMITASVYLFMKPAKPANPKTISAKHLTAISFIDKEGNQYNYKYNRLIGIIISIFVGYLSSLLGIGGGIIHVPILVNVLDFPVHVATATSHFILAIMALTGTIVHIITGSFAEGIGRTLAIGAGALLGAQIGAKLSTRIHGKWIIKGLALALLFVGIRILYMAIQ